MPLGSFGDNLKSPPKVTPFPYLKLASNGQLARFRVLTNHWWWEWVHTLRAPIIDIEGRPQVETKTRQDKTTYLAFTDDFVAQAVCLGDPDVLGERGLDPDRCPMCAAAARGLKGAMPERRFAFTVVKFAIIDKAALRRPPSAEVLVWRLSQKMYNALRGQEDDIRDLLQLPEDAEVTLDMADIVIECTSEQYGRTDFKPPKRPGYAHAEVAAYVDALVSDPANLPTPEQLKLACARTGQFDLMGLDATRAEKRWARAERFGLDVTKWPETGAPVSGGDDPDADKRLDSLLDNASGYDDDDDAVPPPAGPSAEDPWTDDAPAPVKVPATVGGGAQEEPGDFKDVWGDED